MSVRSACGSFRPFVVTVFAAVIAAGIPSIAAEVKSGVIFTPGIDLAKTVNSVNPGTVVNIDAALLKTCRRAWLRTVVESLADREGVVKVGSEMSLVLPRAPTRDNGNKIVDMPIDPAKLTPSTRLVFSLADPGQAGYRVDMASVVLEHETD